ncbi:YidB family protein [Streptomyces sp. NPDC002851]
MTQSNDLGTILGGLLGGDGRPGPSRGGGILGALITALMSNYGDGRNALSGLLDGLTRAGLTDQAKSWVSTGENQPLTVEQLRRALPDEVLQQAAQEAGVSPEQAADQIARELPQAIDRLTPNGEVPTSMDELIKHQRL